MRALSPLAVGVVVCSSRNLRSGVLLLQSALLRIPVSGGVFSSDRVVVYSSHSQMLLCIPLMASVVGLHRGGCAAAAAAGDGDGGGEEETGGEVQENQKHHR